MLSYRHAFHAGNYADVLKHAVITFILDYLKQKDKPFYVHDTHAGAGRYLLTDDKAQKTGEYKEGIEKVLAKGDAPAALQPYLDLVKAMNPGELLHYPGSPWLAKAMLRDQDRLFLTELHPADLALLQQAFGRDRQVRIEQADAYETLVAKVPPKEKRGLVIMDPPYEIKEDYQAVVAAISDAYRRFATGTYLLWYPVVERARVEAMMAAFKATGIRKQLRIEQGIRPDTDQHGMTAAGVLVINPPWTLKAAMDDALPWLDQVLAGGAGQYRCDWLVEE
ncbi:23S rRNA (adenine(2030)-N(6))-methyltransferase RlmJ [Gallaecimonas kandeliae]|uniref:23S rRNA (adenine(2030)-N(6))-methyltransferase RlmJ n=1 Tax=Gallaecimonas kandeliae TaxID=3029055 RepID=UPI00264A1D81|nr:23S rRNA (adenine(2030)-N(6))-methyltransferase RlmJ [Gallaecimonas kandeliae]WKE63960.1 23S rRNA (adenine(2030)-N(6))-methyltransferase RlmJ [Gallaecimonas kandeliae]